MSPLAIMILLPLISLALVSCDSGKADKWTAPEFVKEWKIREIRPDSRHRICSMTANDEGFFVLVNATETVYLPPPMPKPLSEMTEREKDDFLRIYAAGKYLSGIAVDRLSKEQRDKCIELLIKHFFPPRKASEMSEDEKQIVMSFLGQIKLTKEEDGNIRLFEKDIREKPIDWHLDIISRGILKANPEERKHYRIQHYDLDGNFIA